MKKVIFVGLCLIVCSLRLSAASSVDGKSSHSVGTVVLKMTDGLGRGIEGEDSSIESFVSLDTGRNFTKNFHLNKASAWTGRGIPFGHYAVKMRNGGSAMAERRVDVFDLFLSLEVPIHLGSVHIELLHKWPSGSTERPEALRLQTAQIATTVKVLSFKRDDGTDFSKQFKAGDAGNVPYGIYDMEVYDAQGGPIHRVVDVFQRETWVKLGLPAYGEGAPYSGPNNVLHGTVRHIPDPERPVYVKMVGVYCESIFDARVGENAASGEFNLATYTEEGTYLLFTIGQSGILDVREIVIPTTGSIDIDLDFPHHVFHP